MKKTPLLDEQGRVIGLVGTVEDVTEQERAEEDLRASQRLLKTVFDTIPHSVFVKDRQGRYTVVNRALTEVWQTPAEQIIGQKVIVQSLRPAHEAEKTQQSDREVMESDRPAAFVRNQTLLDGRMHRLRMKKTPLHDEQGGVIGLVGTLEDITEQERAERELQESQRLLKTIFDHLPYGLSAKDRESRFVMVNRALLRRFGAVPADFLGRTSLEVSVFSPQERELTDREDRQVLGTGTPLEIPPREVLYPDGKVLIRQFLKIPILDEEGRVTGMVSSSHDITQQVRAEQELLRSKALLQTVFDTIPLDIMVKDLDSRIVAMNRRMLEIFSLTEAELAGRQTPLPVRPEELNAILNIDRRVMASGESTDEIHHRTMPDGTSRHYRVIKSPLREESGRITGLVGIAEDITARIAADAALRESKALLQAVFDTIPQDLWVKDRQGRYVSANRGLLRTFGKSIEQIAGQQTAAPATPEELNTILSTDLQVLNSGNSTEVVQSRKLPDGLVRQFRVIKTPLRDDAGRVTGLVGVAEDVTERARSEQQLRESRLLLQTVFDALPLWVFVKDRERRLIMVNRQMAADYGGHLSGVMSGGADDPADAATQAAVRELDEAVLATGKPVEAADLPHTLRGGPTRIMRSLRVPLTGPDGRVTGLVGVSEDITERKRAEQALLQTQKLESLGILAGGIAHDFNNLLTGILGNVELALLDLEPSSHARTPLTNVKNASLMAAGLTRQMLAYSGGGRFELRPIALNSLVEDMAQLLRVTVPRNVSVIYRFEPDLPQVEADASQLQQVIMNLITNAAEAMGDRPGEVVLTTGTTPVTRAELATYHLAGDVKEGRYVFLEAADTGCGMPPETLQRIFDPFFTTKFTGRGLGLAAVLGIVRSHKGAIRVTSQVDKGTVFRILLPAGGRAAAAAPPAATVWSGSGTVLVVDDEPPVRQVAAAMLRELGMTVLEAGSGEAAVRQLRDHGAEVGWVLLDASMPGLSGAETLRALRQIVPRLVVVMMSGYGERELQERFRGQDVRGFLQKPFTFEDLSGKLNELLGHPVPGVPPG
jgi:PAS domain S-box-containing protein